MRVLVVSVPQAGHFNPLAPLIEAFVASGDEVVVATAEDMRTPVEAVGATLRPSGHGIGHWFAQLQARTRGTPGDGLPPERIAHYFVPRMFADVAVADMVDDVVAAGEELSPDLVVFDAFAFAGPLVAARLGVPGVNQLFGPAPEHDVLALATDALSPLWRSFGMSVPPHAGIYDGVTLAICPPSLDAARPVGGEVVEVRPTPLPVRASQPRDRPLVYLTLGTMWAAPDVVDTVLAALADEPVDVVVTLGGLDPASLAAPPANVTVTSFVPQAELLPDCAVVVHHAGAGTMFGALAHGLPQLALPQAADNYVNADHLATSGAGLVLRPAACTVGAVRDAVRALLTDPSYAVAARRIAGEIAAMATPADAVDRLRARVETGSAVRA